jgi:hypothetical protein
MKSVYKKFTCLLFVVFTLYGIPRAQEDDKKIRIIMIGAHPDDCDDDGGGTAALFAQMGYAVKNCGGNQWRCGSSTYRRSDSG